MEIKKEIKLNNGQSVIFHINEDDGYISSIKAEGYDFTIPKGNLNKLLDSIKWSQLNKVAIYTRMRFLMLKEGIDIEGIDCETLSEELIK